MNHNKTHILKFGGTSLKDNHFIQQAAKLVAKRDKIAQPVVVVSAVDGTTNKLIEIADQPKNSASIIDKLEKKHLALYQKFNRQETGTIQLRALFSELRRITDGKNKPIKSRGALRDQILSIGERASVILFSAALSDQYISSQPYEASAFIKTNSNFGEAKVKLAQSRTLIRQTLQDRTEVPVITGFIASDGENRVTTLGRSGSDYTAGLIADALDADQLEIWTDVDGVLTADPQYVSTATNIEALSFQDIEELSAHGANVIHPKTIRPIRKKDTTVYVKNSFNPSHAGTAINRNFHSNGSFKTVTLEGPFVLLQVKSEHTYSLLAMLRALSNDKSDAFTFKQNSPVEPARFLIEQSFFNTIQETFNKWKIDNQPDISFRSNVYQIKKFSNQFNCSEELTSRIWDLLIKHNIQPLQVDRDLNERFISLLFYEHEALQAAHLFDDYLQQDKKIVNLFLAGTGAVGHTLVQQLKELETEDIEFRLTGICNSRKTLWNKRGINYHQKIDWRTAEPTSWNAILDELSDSSLHNVIFVDATGSEKVARLYPKLIERNIHLVTPSKLANTFEQAFFNKIQQKLKEHSTTFRYETNVGAGLPVISTVENLLNAGDEITKISGTVSGTMTYIFNQLKAGTPFSKTVIKARELGYAEPDPRDDLSGEDVARKFLTLARTIGLEIEREELQVESLIPNELEEVDRDTFLEQLPAYDSAWKERIEQALANDQTLQYTGQLKDGNIKIGIQAVSVDSPFGQLKGTDNLIQLFTKFYNQTPLVIQGPGAGKEVTAAGVISDVLKTANELQ